ncbi:centrosome-associated protein Alms1a-like [Condylostylus longicornis]|uniref:centrosome-associated protein Alms1a-like n=1 Tax=Condylostylus longicornis TaxID=2530218 RepID=UPI00244E5395|nr:centrosome-associated protein Alms1a-like [Condylostylus longicornis]
MSDQNKSKSMFTKSSEQLNKQILEYYYKFGQNRDLEKYLRLNTKTNKSSSEGSLSGLSKYSSDIYTKNEGRQAKSLDYFENITNSDEAQCDEKFGDNILEFENLSIENEGDKLNQKENTSLKNFSTEIDLNDTCDSSKKSAKRNLIGDCNKSLKKDKSIDLKLVQRENKVKANSNLGQKEKLLEWDSLGDVGYNKPFESSNLCRSMSTIERSVLKGFFADKGIEISFPTDKITKDNKGDCERWRTVLENVKKKYSSSPNLLRKNSIETSINKTNQQETIQKRDSLLRKKAEAHPEISSIEKWCQTSIIGKENQLVQCNFSTSNSAVEDQSVTSQSSFIYVAQEFESTGNNSGQTSTTNESHTVETFVNKKLHESVHKYIESKNLKNVNAKTKEIDLGISLLCSLIESNNFNNHQKKKLAQKIVLKITKHRPITTEKLKEDSSINSIVSNIETLSSTSSSEIKITSRKASVDVGTQITIGLDQLHPDRMNLESGSFLKSSALKTQSSSQGKNVSRNNIERSSKSTAHQIDESRKVNQFSKGSNPQLFETMKEWLEPLTNSEFEYDKKLKNKSKENINAHEKVKSLEILEKKRTALDSESDIQKKIHLSWIETEIKRLENLKSLLINEDNKKECNVQCSENTEEEKSNKLREYDSVFESNHLTKKLPDTKRSLKPPTYNDRNFGSRLNEHKIKKILENISNTISESQMTRSKLKTPIKENNDHDSSDSIRTFAQNRKREFIENYKIAHSSIRSYDHPMVSDHYSEPGYKNIPIANKDFIFGSKYCNTSESTLNDFISSESISIPVVNSGNSSTSTTHQYDATAIDGIGVQTSDSVLQTTPIFGFLKEKKCENDRNDHTNKTTRVYGPKGKSEQIQVKPQTISYTIKVGDNEKTEVKYNENLSLRDHLQSQCPRFCERSSKRQEILKEMQRLRKEREEKIRNIAENTSLNSINRKLNYIPPPATKCIRVFSTKEMKALTRKKQKCLPEVVNKVEKEKKEKHRKGTKILTDVFNKRLQRQVHKGKLSLEHSITVI